MEGPGLVSVSPKKDRCCFVKNELVEAWLRKGLGMQGFLGIRDWERSEKDLVGGL